MTTQLTLINSSDELVRQPANWRLDRRTRALGRKGVASARAALRAGRRGPPPSPPRESPGQAPEHSPPEAAGRPAA
jgi:hypothetical protein